MSRQNSYIIESETYLAEIKNLGAEPCRVFNKEKKKEILWNGNPKFWNRHAPILFPIVGKVFEGKYKVNGEAYELSQHGFARDLEWDLVSKKSNELVLKLASTESTLRLYPFEFEITATFKVDTNGFSVQHEVKNISPDYSMLFCIGAHPAFNTPEGIENYEIILAEKEIADQLLLTADGYRSGERKPFFKQNKILPLSEELFKFDALIFDELESESLIIRNINTNEEIFVEWKNYPHLGIWKPLNAPFLCIEPWQGMADKMNYAGEFIKKFGVDELEPNESKRFSWKCSLK
jgi:galactose mutarotase-like enzyme